MTDRWTINITLTRSQPAASAAPVDVPLPVYPGAADPDWADAGLLIDFAHYHACGVRPGDTVWDMTGQHQFTIPAASVLTADGWSRGASNGIVIAASPLFGQQAGWSASLIWNAQGATGSTAAGSSLVGCWETGGPFDWTVRRNGVDVISYKQALAGGEASLPLPSGDTAWRHVYVTYADKQRVYLTGAAYVVHSTEVAAVANRAPLRMMNTGLYRMVRIGLNGAGMASVPGSAGAGDVPAAALANDAAGQVFDPATGIWTT